MYSLAETFRPKVLLIYHSVGGFTGGFALCRNSGLFTSINHVLYHFSVSLSKCVWPGGLVSCPCTQHWITLCFCNLYVLSKHSRLHLSTGWEQSLLLGDQLRKHKWTKVGENEGVSHMENLCNIQSCPCPFSWYLGLDQICRSRLCRLQVMLSG